MNSFFRSKAFIATIVSISFVRILLLGVGVSQYYGGIVIWTLFGDTHYDAVVQQVILLFNLIFTIFAALIITKTTDLRKYETALKALLMLGIAILSFGAVADFIDHRIAGIGLNPLEIFWVPLSIVVPIFQLFASGSYPFGFLANVLTTILQAFLITAIIIVRKNGEIQVKGSTNVLPSASMWTVRIPGQPETPVDTTTLQNWVKTGFISRHTMITELSTGYSYAAHQIPGLFSSKSYVTALLLSFFFGVIGVDRFYLGHVGVGLGKLFTLGGLGIWALIDFILIATKNVKDAQGLPLI